MKECSIGYIENEPFITIITLDSCSVACKMKLFMAFFVLLNLWPKSAQGTFKHPP